MPIFTGCVYFHDTGPDRIFGGIGSAVTPECCEIRAVEAEAHVHSAVVCLPR